MSVAFKRHFNSTADSRYMPKTIRTLPTYRMNVRQVRGERCDFDKHFTLQVLATRVRNNFLDSFGSMLSRKKFNFLVGLDPNACLQSRWTQKIFTAG